MNRPRKRLASLPILYWVALLFPIFSFAQQPVQHYKACNNSLLPPSDLPHIDPPLPSFLVEPRDSSENIPGIVSTAHDYKVTVVADPDFARILPHEANYIIDWISLLIQIGEGAPTQIGRFQPKSQYYNEIVIPLTEFAEQMKPGDQLYFAINRVYRLNYRRQKVLVRIPLHEQFIPLTVE